MDVFSRHKTQIQAFPDFTREPQLTAELVEKVKAGDEMAKMALIQATLKYVLKVVTFLCTKENLWSERLDLLQEANLRITKRISGYDSKKGSLKAFVWTCVNAAFLDYMSRSGIVVSSRYSRRMLRSINHASTSFKERNDREPTDKELSEHLGIDEVRLKRLKNSVVRGFVYIDGPATADEEARSINDTLILKTTTAEEHLLNRDKIEEVHRIAIELFGKREADLWRTYKEGNKDYFFDLYYQLTGKGKGAARKYISRRQRKLMAHIEKKRKRSNVGGDHEFRAAHSR